MPAGRMSIRTASLDLTRADSASRSIPVSLSSEHPVQQWFGLEILDHTPDAIDLGAARDGLPLLTAHNPNEIPRPGNIEGIRLTGRKLRGTLRFGSSKRADEIWEAIQDGVLSGVSIGYKIQRTRPEGIDKRTGLQIIRATRWKLLEASLVNVPADETVGIGRSRPIGRKEVMNRDRAENIPNGEELPTAETPSTVTVTERQDRQREKNMNLLQHANAVMSRYPSQAPRIHELTTRVLESGGSRERFNEGLFEILNDKPPLNLFGDFSPNQGMLGLGQRDIDRFSIRRAILAVAAPETRQEAGFEYEVSRTIGQKLGRGTDGILVPFELLRGRRDLTVGVGTQGGFLVANELHPEAFIDVLRNKSVVMAAGATLMSGLVGNVQIPKKSSASTAYWVAEGVNVTESSMVFAQVTLTPRTVGGLVEFTRKFLLQSSIDAEMLVRADLAQTVAVEVDRAALVGSGTGSEPTGIMNTSGVTAVDFGTNGGAPTWAKMVEFLRSLSIANALQGRLAWVTTPSAQAKLLTVEKAANTGLFVWESPAAANGTDGIIAGNPAYATSQIPSNYTDGTGSNLSGVVFGNWPELVIGQWGALELLSDPYTAFAAGNVRVRAMLDIDAAIRHVASFAVAKDMITT